MDNFTPILKENYGSSKKKRKLQHFAEGGAVQDDQPEGFIPDHEFTPDPMGIEDPQSQMADKGVDQLISDKRAVGDEIYPTTSPLDLIAFDGAPKVVNTLASGLKSNAFKALVGNEVGSVGPGAIQKLQGALGMPVESAMYNDKVRAAQELLARAQAAAARGEAKASDVMFAKQKLKTAQSIATKNAIAKDPKRMADGGAVEPSDMDPQSAIASQGLGQLGQAAANTVDMGPMPSSFQDARQEERPLETPTLDPIDFAGSALAAKIAPSVVDAIASGMSHKEFQNIVGNEIGAVGKNVKSLPMDEASRLARAKSLGFDPSKTYYHGTSADIQAFKPSGQNGSMLGEGTYLTSDPEFAAKYAAKYPQSSLEDPTGGNILPVHTSVTNPFDLSAPASKDIIKALKKEPGIDLDRLKHLSKKGKDNGDILAELQANRIPYWRQTQILQDAGHDAVKDDHVLNVFDSNKIRSKFAEFDPKNKKSSKLSYADGGEVEASDMDPQSAIASQGVSRLGQTLVSNLESGPAISKAPMEGIDPEDSPIDYVVGGLGARLGSSLARDAESIIGNEVGAVGKNVKSLPMDEASRLARAKDMGFDTSKTYYHGSKADIDAFDPNTLGTSTNAPSARKGFFFADDASTASDYADLSKGRATLRAKAIEDDVYKPVEQARNALEKKYGEKFVLPDNDIYTRYTPEQISEMGITSVDPKDPLVKQYQKLSDIASKQTEALHLDYDQEILKHQNALDMLKHNTPASLKAGKKQWEDSIDNVEAILSGKKVEKYPRPKAYLEEKLAQYKTYLADTNEYLSKAGQAQYKKDLKDTGARIAELKSAKNAEKTGQNVIPVHLKMENPYIHDYKGVGYREESYNDIIQKAKELGHDSVILKNTYDPADRENRVLQNINVVFDPSQIRSKFAEFNPKKKGSGNLSFAEGGMVSNMPDSFFAEGGMAETPPGFIPDAEFKPDSIGQPAVDNQTATPPGFIPDEEFKSDEDTYGTPMSIAKTALEGVGQGVLGPLAPLGEKALGVRPQDMRLREETNPITHGLFEAAGFVGSMLAGTGEAALVGKAGQGITNALKIGLEGSGAGSQIAASAVRAAAETALLQSGDEVSRVIKEDPNQSLQTAAAHVGLSGLLGGGVGVILGSVHPLWKATFGDKLGQVAADFKGRMNEHLANPDPVGAVTDELSDHYAKMKDIADEVYGPVGLKAQDIAKAMPEMSDKITNQSQEIANKLQTTVDKMLKKPSTYPPRLTNKLQDDLNEYLMKVSSPEANPAQIFDATQNLKQATQSYAKFDRFVKPVDEAYDFVRDAKGLARELRTSLEDSAVWGKAAQRQQAINKGFSEFLPSLKDFEKKFTVEVSGERVLDPGKINTYMNQLGKPNAEIKQDILRNFLGASEKYKKVIGDTHANLGIDNPIQPSSLTASYNTLKEVTPGAKLADLFIKKGLTDAGGKAIGAGVGEAVGHGVGASGGIGAFIGAHVLGPFFSSVLPAIAKPLLQRDISAMGMKSAMDYGLAVSKGAALIEKAAANVFKDEPVLAEHLMPNDKDRARLTKQLTAIQDNPEVMMKENDLGHYLPDHSIAMSATAASAVGYLNSLRPNRDKGAPLDSPRIPSNAEKAKFTNAISIAQQPLLVLDKVKRGTVTPEDIKALQALYPDLYKSMNNKLMSAMTTHLSKDKIIPYKTRLGLSMFVGMPLDSTMSPMGIQAAQPQQQGQSPQQNQGAIKTAHNTSKLGETNKMYMTPEQASAAHKAKKE